MFKLVIVGTVFTLAAATRSLDHPIRHDIVYEIRERATWKAHDPETNPLRNFTRDQLLGLVSTFMPEPKSFEIGEEVDVSALPTNYDPRSDLPKDK